MTLLIDENYNNYKYILDWIISFKDVDVWYNLVKDIKLNILSNNKIPLMVITFVQAFPTSISTINFSSQNDDSEVITVDVNFYYQYFLIDTVRYSN